MWVGFRNVCFWEGENVCPGIFFKTFKRYHICNPTHHSFLLSFNSLRYAMLSMRFNQNDTRDVSVDLVSENVGEISNIIIIDRRFSI